MRREIDSFLGTRGHKEDQIFGVELILSERGDNALKPRDEEHPEEHNSGGSVEILFSKPKAKLRGRKVPDAMSHVAISYSVPHDGIYQDLLESQSSDLSQSDRYGKKDVHGKGDFLIQSLVRAEDLGLTEKSFFKPEDGDMPNIVTVVYGIPREATMPESPLSVLVSRALALQQRMQL